MKLRPEEQVCQAYVEWFDLQYPHAADFLSHVPNERADVVTRKVLASLGVRPGVHDYLLFERRAGFVGMALEMKRGGATLSDVTKDQRRWATRLALQGWFTAVAYGIDEAMEITNAYMGNRIEDRHWFRPGEQLAKRDMEARKR